MEILLTIALPAVGGFVVAYFITNSLTKKKREHTLKSAEQEGENIKKEKIFQAKEKFLQLKSEHEQHIIEKNNLIAQQETKLKQREIAFNQQNSELQKKSKEIELIRENLKNQLEIVEKKGNEYEKLRQEAIAKIENLAGMSAVQAKEQLIDTMKDEAKSEALSYISEAIDEARLTASKEAKRIIINTIQRLSPETAIENAVTVFNIESDEIKGRIIDRKSVV